MTVGVVVRVPGQGAVLACDSRYACGDSIITDTHRKWFQLGSCVGVWAGSPGGMLVELEEKPPRNWQELRERLSDPKKDRDYDVLVYDRTKDRVLNSDEQGDLVLVGNHYAIGSGGAIALGVLDAAKAPTTLDAAAKLAARAVKFACKRQMSCGGRIRVVIVKGRRGAVVVK